MVSARDKFVGFFIVVNLAYQFFNYSNRSATYLQLKGQGNNIEFFLQDTDGIREPGPEKGYVEFSIDLTDISTGRTRRPKLDFYGSSSPIRVGGRIPEVPDGRYNIHIRYRNRQNKLEQIANQVEVQRIPRNRILIPSYGR